MKKGKEKKTESTIDEILLSITENLIERFKLRGIVVMAFEDGKFDIIHNAKD